MRLHELRLAQPAWPLFVFFAVVLGAAVLVGAPSDVVSAAAVGAGSPLWFLAAYLLCQALVPPLFTLHTDTPERFERAERALDGGWEIGEGPAEAGPLVLERIE